jgi:UDP-N-acetylmuramoylalanine--D-glutamate ligase
VTNLFPDHLDRHGTYREYVEAKRAILDFQEERDVAVLPHGEPGVRAAGFLRSGRGRRVLAGEGGDVVLEGRTVVAASGVRASLEGLPLWGEHNLTNALLAAAAALQVPGVGAEHVTQGALATKPLPHRLEPVAEVDGVLYVDDSIATNPGSAIAVLQAVPRPAVVLAGGKEKGLDPTPLLDALAARARAVVGIGTSGPDLVRRLSGRVRAVEGGADLTEAVRTAASLARPGDAVLLSPGFSSLDQYASFAARGEAFRRAVASLRGAGPCSSPW